MEHWVITIYIEILQKKINVYECMKNVFKKKLFYN